MSAVVQWAIAILAVLGAFFVAGIAASFAAGALGFWEFPWAGFLAALAVVVTAYVAAPSHKTLFACGTFALGALAAWVLLEPSFYPDGPRYTGIAYQQTHVPIIATYVGGLIGLAVACTLRLRSGA